MQRRAIGAAGLGLAFAASLMLWPQLAGDTFLRGFDAYYYAVQADWLFRTGHVRVPDSSLIHYLTAGLMHLGLSAEQALKLWACASLFLFCSALAFFPRARAARSIGFVLLCWAAASPALLFTALEFPKTFAAVIFLPLWLVCLRPEAFRPFLLAALMAVAALFHKMALVYAGVAVLCLAVRFLHHRRALPGKNIGIALVAVGGIFALLLWLPADALHVRDLLRLRGANLTPGLIALLREPGLPAAIAWECLFAAAALVFALVKSPLPAVEKLPALGLALTAFIPALGNESFSFGERFGILFPCLCLLGCAWLLRTGPELPRPRLVVACALILGLAGAFWRLPYAHPESLDPPYAEYEAVVRVLAPMKLPMLVLHRGMHFYYKYRTGMEAFSYEPEPHWNKKRVSRLIYGALPNEIYARLPAECSWEDARLFPTERYILLREDCYADLRDALQREDNPELHDLLWNDTLNPNTPRPAFLYNKHKNEEPTEFPALPPKP